MIGLRIQLIILLGIPMKVVIVGVAMTEDNEIVQSLFNKLTRRGTVPRRVKTVKQCGTVPHCFNV
jgi:hypothetical protein